MIYFGMLLLCATVASTQAANPSPVPQPSAARAFSPDDGKKMLAEFNRALRTEVEALKHRQKFELKDLEASQKARRKEWLHQEAEKRHAVFATMKGPEKRVYTQDYVARLKALDRILKDEYAQRVHEQEVRLKAMKDDQATRLREFQDSLAHNQPPPRTLWPAAGT